MVGRRRALERRPGPPPQGTDPECGQHHADGEEDPGQDATEERRPRMRTTSSSLTCPKCRYHCPTAWNRSGVSRATTASASRASWRTAWAGATGTARTTAVALRARAQRSAATAVL